MKNRTFNSDTKRSETTIINYGRSVVSILFFITFFLVCIYFPGCTWDYPEPINAPPPPPPPCDTCTPNDTDTTANVSLVSFSNHIQPIFTSNCAKSGCHVTGAYPGGMINLSAGNAYNDLLTKTGQNSPISGLKYVDTLSDANSGVYIKISAGKTMEQYLARPTQRDTILLWIEQGARNN